MKLIIDIPEYVYKVCLGHGDIVYQYIAKGTPYEEQPTGEWIFVKERLPEKDGDYIVYFIWNDGEEDVGKCWYNTRNGFTFDHVVAWMPLPEPPKKGGAE